MKTDAHRPVGRRSSSPGPFERRGLKDVLASPSPKTAGVAVFGEGDRGGEDLPPQPKRIPLALAALVSLGLGLLLTGLRFSSAYAVYPLKRLVYWPLAALALFAFAAPAVTVWLRPVWARQSAPARRTLLLSALALLPLAAWLLPFPRPDLPAPHRLVISAERFPQTAAEAANAILHPAPTPTGRLVEIRRISYLSGAPVEPSRITHGAGWQEEGGVLYSRGGPDARLELSGDLPGGVVVDLRYSPEGGPVRLEWDGWWQWLNLSARESSVVPFIFSGLGVFKQDSSQSRLPLPQALLLIGLSALQLVGLYAVILGGLLVVFLAGQFAGKRAGGPSGVSAVSLSGERAGGPSGVSAVSPFGERAVSPSGERAASFALCAVIMLGLFLGFLYLKYTGLRADTPRIFRDTLAYAQAADLPLTSPAFWAGTRAFSLPLFFKLLGVNSANYADGAHMQRVAQAQAALAIFSWTVLALVAAWCAPRRRSAVMVFGLILYFNLSLEIGIWDTLLLSESLTFSLLALMLAGWLAVVRGYAHLRPLARAGLLLVTGLVMLLYTFTRDSNIYFVLGGLVVLLGGWLLQTRGGADFRRKADFRSAKQAALGLAAIAGLCFIAQNVSLSAGNRWQIFMYDHLAVRFLSDPTARDFFAGEGLPISDQLLATTHMAGYEYQPLFYSDPAFQPVRVWVATRSKAAYLKYLLTRPGETLLQPITNAPKLIWGSNLEYRSPLGGVLPAPQRLAQLTAFFYDRRPALSALLALAVLAGLWINLRERGSRRDPSPLWLLVALLLITLYPLMFLVWHAEPLEVERHAAQLGIQFYLAGWLAAALVIDWAIEKANLHAYDKN